MDGATGQREGCREGGSGGAGAERGPSGVECRAVNRTAVPAPPPPACPCLRCCWLGGAVCLPVKCLISRNFVYLLFILYKKNRFFLRRHHFSLYLFP